MTSVTFALQRTAQYANSTAMAQGIADVKSYYGNMDVTALTLDDLTGYSEETSFVNQALFDLNPDSGDDSSSAHTIVVYLGAGLAILSAVVF